MPVACPVRYSPSNRQVWDNQALVAAARSNGWAYTEYDFSSMTREGWLLERNAVTFLPVAGGFMPMAPKSAYHLARAPQPSKVGEEAQ